MKIKKNADNDEQQIFYAEVYLPDTPDADNNFMTAEDVRKMSYDYMANPVATVDLNHDNNPTECQVVESFIVRDGDPVFQNPGAWVIGVHVPDDDLWAAVKSGEYSGISIEASVLMSAGDEPDAMVEVPEYTTGFTAKEADHQHTFTLRIDENGRVSGVTDVVDGHSHEIKHLARTVKTDGHLHRFNFWDFVDADVQEIEKAHKAVIAKQ